MEEILKNFVKEQCNFATILENGKGLLVLESSSSNFSNDWTGNLIRNFEEIETVLVSYKRDNLKYSLCSRNQAITIHLKENLGGFISTDSEGRYFWSLEKHAKNPHLFDVKKAFLKMGLKEFLDRHCNCATMLESEKGLLVLKANYNDFSKGWIACIITEFEQIQTVLVSYSNGSVKYHLYTTHLLVAETINEKLKGSISTDSKSNYFWSLDRQERNPNLYDTKKIIKEAMG